MCKSVGMFVCILRDIKINIQRQWRYLGQPVVFTSSSEVFC